MDCPDGFVPGWLDESGNPTSCVADNPGFEPEPFPTPPEPLTPIVGDTPTPPTVDAPPVADVSSWTLILLPLILALVKFLVRRR